MSTCDARDGRFISYFNEYQHWKYPENSPKRFVLLNMLIPGINSQQCQMEYDLPWQIFLCHFKWVVYAQTHVICSYLVQNTRGVRKLKYFDWARLMKRPDDQCLYLHLSDQWLHDNWFSASGQVDSSAPGAAYMR